MRSKLSRRDFLALVAAGAAACHRSSSSTSSTSSSSSSSATVTATTTTTKTLPPSEARILDAITARILPSDDGPGAREANTLVFMDNQLSSGDLVPLAPAVIACARIVDGEAKRRHGSAFVDLDPSRQDAILSDFAEEKLPVVFPQRVAFRLLHMLTIESLLSDPIHGGNDKSVGWKWIRFPTPTLRTPGGENDHEHHD